MNPALSADPDLWELVVFFGPKIMFAMICGGIVGLERELKQKSAGIKTTMLICVGSAIYTGLSVLVASRFSSSHYFGDPGRIAAQIVSGVGFLGGGAILQSRGAVLGLTTAALIWVMAAIGIMVGLGYGWLGVLSSLSVVGVLILIRRFEQAFIGHSHHYHYEIMAEDPDGHFRKSIKPTLEHHALKLEDVEVTMLGKLSLFRIRYQGSDKDHKGFLLAVWNLPGVREVRQAHD
jgi:putative Mg2+ transporter-C (MgtC) family protein